MKIKKIEFCSCLGYKKISAKLNSDYRDKLKGIHIGEYRVYKILSYHNDFFTSLKNKKYYHLIRSKLNPFLDLLDKKNRYVVDYDFKYY